MTGDVNELPPSYEEGMGQLGGNAFIDHVLGSGQGIYGVSWGFLGMGDSGILCRL